jgi:hypothetical protein
LGNTFVRIARLRFPKFFKFRKPIQFLCFQKAYSYTLGCNLVSNNCNFRFGKERYDWNTDDADWGEFARIFASFCLDFEHESPKIRANPPQSVSSAFQWYRHFPKRKLLISRLRCQYYFSMSLSNGYVSTNCFTNFFINSRTALNDSIISASVPTALAGSGKL